MTVTLAQIGNSKGIRIPQAILKEIGFIDQAEMEIKNNKIIITPTQKNRKNWLQEFKKLAQNKNDQSLLPDAMSQSWDQEEWQW